MDQGYAPPEWAFDDEVTRVFDDMLQRSIPDYEAMRALTLDMGSRFVQDDTYVIDLGCSRGGSLAPFVDRFGARVGFMGLDSSEPMVEAASDRFAGMIRAGVVDIRLSDLRSDPVPRVPASLILSVLTLQFVPVEYRQAIVLQCWDRLRAGGALLLVEKVIGATPFLQTTLVSAYEDAKRAAGYSDDEIARKRASLENRLVPLSARWNEELLSRAGFRDVECYWRRLSFAAWIAVKT